jgi:HSP20 family protein
MTARFDPFQELERVSQAVFGSRQGPRVMPMDLYREGDHYILNADLPGLDPGSVDIDVDGQLLTIRAQRTLKESEGTKWLLKEREGGSFLRQLTLGQDIDIDNIAAHYDNGVLSVTIPVSEATRRRKIEVAPGHRQEAVEAAGGQGGAAVQEDAGRKTAES